MVAKRMALIRSLLDIPIPSSSNVKTVLGFGMHEICIF
ncbi:hypothetical protein B4120_1844 [Bacillus cereus]|nr:hypothetical protein B4120_1844 [Bacillus cereus]